MDWLIKINGARVILDRHAYLHGRVKIAPGTMSEQCEGCGCDIAETGAYHTLNDLKCSECGQRYDVITELL